jgi:hypothetical protein
VKFVAVKTWTCRGCDCEITDVARPRKCPTCGTYLFDETNITQDVKELYSGSDKKEEKT